MFEIYFVVLACWADNIRKRDIVTSLEDAMAKYEAANVPYESAKLPDEPVDEPAELYKCRKEEDGHTHLFWYNKKTWVDMGPIYFAVRQDAGLRFPETVIAENSIFNNMEDADRYVEKHGGEWKIYSWEQLLSKLDERTIVEAMKQDEELLAK